MMHLQLGSALTAWRSHVHEARQSKLRSRLAILQRHKVALLGGSTLAGALGYVYHLVSHVPPIDAFT